MGSHIQQEQNNTENIKINQVLDEFSCTYSWTLFYSFQDFFLPLGLQVLFLQFHVVLESSHCHVDVGRHCKTLTPGHHLFGYFVLFSSSYIYAPIAKSIDKYRVRIFFVSVNEWHCCREKSTKTIRHIFNLWQVTVY